MKVRIIVPQTGLYNGAPWPAPGETIDLPEHVAEGMIRNGHVENAKGKASDEAREAADKAAADLAAADVALKADTEAAEAAAAKVETRPAPTVAVETPEKPSEATKKTASKKS